MPGKRPPLAHLLDWCPPLWLAVYFPLTPIWAAIGLWCVAAALVECSRNRDQWSLMGLLMWVSFGIGWPWMYYQDARDRRHARTGRHAAGDRDGTVR